MTDRLVKMWRFPFLLALLIALDMTTKASAEPISCTAFLHERDGGWRSFNEADILGPHGPVHIQVGERLFPTERSAKGEIARALNALCENQ